MNALERFRNEMPWWLKLTASLNHITWLAVSFGVSVVLMFNDVVIPSVYWLLGCITGLVSVASYVLNYSVVSDKREDEIE